MAIDNSTIADRFSLLAKLMDIHNENPFKIKSYSVAAFTIDKLPESLADLPRDKITAIKGIGPSTGKLIAEMLDGCPFQLLNDMIFKTPAGVMEMLKIKGLGPKKIATIWKEMEIESIGELMYACNENRLTLFKGFGEKTQNSIRDTISFYLKNQGSFLYAEIEGYALKIQKNIQEQFPSHQIKICGAVRRHLEIIHKIEWVTSIPKELLQSFLEKNQFSVKVAGSDEIIFSGPENIELTFYCSNSEKYFKNLFDRSSSESFLETWEKMFGQNDAAAYASEEAIFAQRNIHYIEPFLREDPAIIEKAKKQAIPECIRTEDIKGIIHSHSNWSDGSETIETMAKACIAQGFEYLVISDHSKSAFYANGLSEERIREQHKYIDELNQQLSPFTIFKSIESDILNDGNLDYSDQLLSTFDLVIASVHSNLKMSEEKAMNRLLRAIENPHTTILGHMTGRLLLSRPGYPVDHKKIIDACAANNVVIELNAHPRRLDIDWRWITYALEKNVLISIDPDAHSVAGYHDIHYGVLAAQKGGLRKEHNLSSFNLEAIKRFLEL